MNRKRDSKNVFTSALLSPPLFFGFALFVVLLFESLLSVIELVDILEATALPTVWKVLIIK